ncbi:MAG TPA: nicotinate phosphoribosyltransferase [Sutterella sp.]|nr:nicotinate phosphoribosyltransferase [Sutterella sp.]
MNDIYISQEEYDDLVERLVLQVAESGYQFDTILCLARGGMRVGDIFSRVHDMPLAILAASSYREEAGKKQSTLDIATFITKTGGDIAGKLLLVDDMLDTGKTAIEVIDHLKKKYPAVTEIRTAVLWLKARSLLKPDYYVEFLEGNPWIHQPFERYDALGIERLRQRHGLD